MIDLFDKYVSIVKQNLLSIYSDMTRYYSDIIAIKKEVYNIGITALKDFGAVDPLNDKIDELLFLYQNSENEDKKEIREKLSILNQALKIINEDLDKERKD